MRREPHLGAARGPARGQLEKVVGLLCVGELGALTYIVPWPHGGDLYIGPRVDRMVRVSHVGYLVGIFLPNITPPCFQWMAREI